MANKGKKDKPEIPWLEIKAKYMSGINPEAISQELKIEGLTGKKIGDYACRQGWSKERKALSVKISETAEDKYTALNNKAMTAIEKAIDKFLEDGKISDRVLSVALKLAYVGKAAEDGKPKQPADSAEIAAMTNDQLDQEIEKYLE